jgi:hypothetical protein
LGGVLGGGDEETEDAGDEELLEDDRDICGEL